MSDEPDLTKGQEQILRALGKAWEEAAPGYLTNEELAEQLEMDEDELRENVQALIDLGFVEGSVLDLSALPPALEQTEFVQIECDWQDPDGNYCNELVRYFGLDATSPQDDPAGVQASLAGFCSLEHANDAPRPTLDAAKQLYANILATPHCPTTAATLVRKLIDNYPSPVLAADFYAKDDR